MMYINYTDMMDDFGAEYDMDFDLDDELLLEDEERDWLDDYYDEMGYNPYLGGYDYDC